MKVKQDAALSLLNKYVEERTPVFAALVTPSVSVARVTGTIRISIADGVPRLYLGLNPSTRQSANPLRCLGQAGTTGFPDAAKSANCLGVMEDERQ